MDDHHDSLRPKGRLRFREGRELDLRGQASFLAARMLTTVYRRMLCLVYPLQGRTIPIYSAQIDVDFRVLRADEISDYLRFRAEPSRHVIEARLERGDRCFASWYQGAIVDACWIATGSAYVLYMQRFIALDRGDVYSYDSYTLPEFRGYGLFMARNSFTARRNQQEGLERSVALVAPENYASWVILTRSGLETIGEYSCIRSPLGAVYRDRAIPGRKIPRLESSPHRVSAKAPANRSGAAA